MATCGERIIKKAKRFTKEVKRKHGIVINHKRVYCLMKELNIQAKFKENVVILENEKLKRPSQRMC